MPPNDAALVGWLKSQPGVTGASVEREGKTLVITYAVEGGQPMPGVLDKAETLGYAERGSFFGDLRAR